MVTFNWDKEDCENLRDFMEMCFFQNLHDLYDIGELDNFGYLKSFVKMYDDLDAEVKNKKKKEEK